MEPDLATMHNSPSIPDSNAGSELCDIDISDAVDREVMLEHLRSVVQNVLYRHCSADTSTSGTEVSPASESCCDTSVDSTASIQSDCPKHNMPTIEEGFEEDTATSERHLAAHERLGIPSCGNLEPVMEEVDNEDAVHDEEEGTAVDAWPAENVRAAEEWIPVVVSGTTFQTESIASQLEAIAAMSMYRENADSCESTTVVNWVPVDNIKHDRRSSDDSVDSRHSVESTTEGSVLQHRRLSEFIQERRLSKTELGINPLAPGRQSIRHMARLSINRSVLGDCGGGVTSCNNPKPKSASTVKRISVSASVAAEESKLMDSQIKCVLEPPISHQLSKQNERGLKQRSVPDDHQYMVAGPGFRDHGQPIGAAKTSLRRQMYRIPSDETVIVPAAEVTFTRKTKGSQHPLSTSKRGIEAEVPACKPFTRRTTLIKAASEALAESVLTAANSKSNAVWRSSLVSAAHGNVIAQPAGDVSSVGRQNVPTAPSAQRVRTPFSMRGSVIHNPFKQRKSVMYGALCADPNAAKKDGTDSSDVGSPKLEQVERWLTEFENSLDANNVLTSILNDNVRRDANDDGSSLNFIDAQYDISAYDSVAAEVYGSRRNTRTENVTAVTAASEEKCISEIADYQSPTMVTRRKTRIVSVPVMSHSSKGRPRTLSIRNK
jgi:hypothetical protein